MPKQHIVIIAGETSGDNHAAKLVTSLLEARELHITGIGGPRMAECGVTLLSDLAKYSVTGFTEVFTHLKQIRQAYQIIKQHLISTKPDLLILIDYPGFNLRLAKLAKSIGIKILYYISPQIWAWKAKRIETIKRVVDMMAVILPFEKKIYEEAGVPVKFVGHPLIESTVPSRSALEARKAFGLNANKKTIALLPGSRRNEIKQLLPTLAELVEKLNQKSDDYQFIVPLAPSLNKKMVLSLLGNVANDIHLIENQFIDVMNCCDAAIVASGTASLECALLEKPMAIIYKSSRLSYCIACQLVKVKYVGLCNLLANRLIVPELIQSDCTVEHLMQTVDSLSFNENLRQSMSANLKRIKQSLSQESIDCSLDALVLSLLDRP